MGAPPFPTGSLYGAFPTFPISYVKVPDILTLPSWIYNEIAYYTNVLNYPYNSPPALLTWSIPYPNILKLPQFFLNILYWIVGLAGAAFEWIFAYAAWGLGTIGTDVINTSSGLLNDLINYAVQISNQTGIFAPLIEVAFLAIVVLAAIGIAFVVVNAVKVLI
jgi:hypothetical protein